VQLLTIEELTVTGMNDPALRQNILNCFESYIAKVFSPNESQSRLAWVQIMYLTHDIKYMSKDSTLPKIL
jgi:hypothetical protein